MRLSQDRRGIGGFFLDLPILMIVIVAILLFVVTFSSLYFKYQEEVEERKQYDACLDIKDKVELYDAILYEYDEGLKKGHFSVNKLNKIEDEDILAQIKTDTRYKYNISIKNREDEGQWYLGNEITDEDIDISTYTVPVTLVNRNGVETDIGQLSVILWKG